MHSFTRFAFCLLTLVVVVGCASTKVSNRQEFGNERIPRPDHIWVYDFAATPAEVPTESAFAGQSVEHTTPQTAEQIANGRQVGGQIAKELVEEIRAMGMPGMRVSSGTKPQVRVNDLVIQGYLLSIEEGGAGKRVAMGFGAGASELDVAAEGFQMTAQGLRKLGSGTLHSEGAKTPGGALGVASLIATGNPVGLIVGGGLKVYGEESGSSKVEGRAKAVAKEIADRLRPKFQQQGWLR